MSRILDKDATIQLLASLEPGKPVALNPGDSFHHPTHGPMLVSKVYGWERGHQLNKRGGGFHFDPIRAFVVSAFRQGRKKAEKVNFLPPAKKEVA